MDPDLSNTLYIPIMTAGVYLLKYSYKVIYCRFPTYYCKNSDWCKASMSLSAYSHTPYLQKNKNKKK